MAMTSKREYPLFIENESTELSPFRLTEVSFSISRNGTLSLKAEQAILCRAPLAEASIQENAEPLPKSALKSCSQVKSITSLFQIASIKVSILGFPTSKVDSHIAILKDCRHWSCTQHKSNKLRITSFKILGYVE